MNAENDLCTEDREKPVIRCNHIAGIIERQVEMIKRLYNCRGQVKKGISFGTFAYLRDAYYDEIYL